MEKRKNSKWTFREVWENYHGEIVFGIVLTVVICVSTYLARFIPERIFDHVLTPAFNIATSTVALFGAWVISRHTEGLLVRKIWIIALLFWFLGDMFYLVCYLVAPLQVMNMGAAHLTTFELLFGKCL